MPVPCLYGNLDHCEQHAKRRKKALGALPVLLVAIHAAFQIGQTSAVTVAMRPAICDFSTLRSLITWASNSFIMRMRRTPSRGS
jgi:hypothetical protein